MEERKVVCISAVLILFIAGMIPGFVFAQNADLSGRIYSDYTYNFTNSQNSFDIKRVYLGYEGRLAPSIDFVVISDMEVADYAEISRLFMKYAYANWHSKCGDVLIGMIPTNPFEVQKRTWGLRYLYKTVMNEYRFSSSADIGIRYDRAISEDLSLSAMVSNGTGYKSAEDDIYKRLHLRLLYGPDNLGSTEGMNVGIYGSWEPDNVPMYDHIFTAAAFAGVHRNNVWAGVEGAVRDIGPMDVTITLLSAYVRHGFTDEIQGFLRVDRIDWENSDDELTLIAGAQYVKYKGFSVAPNIIYRDYAEENWEEIGRAHV